MSDEAVFKGGIVAMKNVGYDASIHLTVALPQELGAAVIAAFGWPTTRSPIPVAIARLKEEADLPKRQAKPEPRHFNDLSPAEQAGILCKEEDFREFLQGTAHYKNMPSLGGYTVEELVRAFCGVQSRAEIKEGTLAARQWKFILDGYRRWQADRDRADVNS